MGSVISGLSRIPYGRAFALTSLPSPIPASCLMRLGIVVTPFLPILMTFSNFLANSRTRSDNLNLSLSIGRIKEILEDRLVMMSDVVYRGRVAFGDAVAVCKIVMSHK